ncbi:cbb3-type cytochrome oxidase assembly protein CcoS [Thalassotalea ganghwensis]
MSIIYVLIPIAIILTALGIYLFFWAVKTDQFDDLEKQGLSILFEEDKQNKPPKSNSQEQDIPQAETNSDSVSKNALNKE